jgi:transposase
MHGPYPGELRTRVSDFVEEGGSRREAAEQFDVSVSSAIRWVQRFRENGTFEPMPRADAFRSAGMSSEDETATLLG